MLLTLNLTPDVPYEIFADSLVREIIGEEMQCYYLIVVDKEA